MALDPLSNVFQGRYPPPASGAFRHAPTPHIGTGHAFKLSL